MSTESKDLISVVEKLRQEQEFVFFYKNQIRQSVQELNNCCDNVFHSLWLNHVMAYCLNRVLAHQLQCIDWGIAFDQINSVDFVDASKTLKSSLLIERYGKFLNALKMNPTLLSDVLLWAESEGLDMPLLVNDLMSVVYGHCMFPYDHLQFLQLLKILLKHHISSCVTPKDLFSGVEPIFSCVLAEYCSQLVDLRTILTEAFQEPLQQLLKCEDYLEFDVNKAASRFQSGTDQTASLVETSKFLFSEDLESSCEQLAKVSMFFLDGLYSLLGQFPLSLKWLLGNLKSEVQLKWPGITLAELRRPISDMLFGAILGAVIVNPDRYGVVEPSVVIGPVVRYNLSQVTSVLQGCAWILDKPNSSKYPIHKVVKRMNVKTFTSVVDTIDGGYGEEVLDLPSSLPGLRRSAYLASQSQLDNVVGLFTQMGDVLPEKEGPQLSLALSHLITPMKERASTSPYVISNNKPVSLSSRPPLVRLDSTTTPNKASKRVLRKKPSEPLKKPPSRTLFPKGRSNSTSNIALLDAAGTPLSGGVRTRTYTRSISPTHSRQVGSSEKLSLRSPPNDQTALSTSTTFSLPLEVLILPAMEQADENNQSRRQWDFDLLSEEEFMGQKSPADQRRSSVKDTSDDLIQFDSPQLTRKENSPSQSNNVHSAGPGAGLSSSLVLPREKSPFIEDNFRKSLKFSGGPLSSPSCSETESPERKLHPLPLPPTSPSYIKESPGVAPSSISAFGEVSWADPQPKKELEFLNPEALAPDVASESSSHSMENLLDMASGEALHSPSTRKKGFKKLKKLFKKRSKDVVKFDEPKHIEEELVRKPRSKSEVHLRHEDIPDVEASLKCRSKSELSPQPVDEVSNSPPKSYKKRRSYTMLTGHITAKYAALEARRKSEPLEGVPKKRKEVSNLKYENVKYSIVEMTPATFRKSLYCHQLMYKLRSALQHIHTPLSTSPIYMQLCADEDSMCDPRYQLLTLLQHTLQRCKWRNDTMEVALLTEILRMVEPLPNQLVAEALEGVHEEYMRRSAYIAYLVKSHRKFQDAKLQVSAVQTAANRTKEVQENLFLHFMVKLFLESQEVELSRFVQELSNLDLADERCSLMEDQLESFTETIVEYTPWIYWPDAEQMVNCLEDHLFAHVYIHLFHPNGDSDTARDQIFSEHLSRLADTISPTHKSLQIPPVYHGSCPWVSAQKHLKEMAVYKSPRGKLRCIVQSCKILISLLQYAKCGEPPGADDLFPVLVYILIKTNPSGLLSTIQYIRNFAENQLGGEDAYWWAQFSTAVEFTKTLE